MEFVVWVKGCLVQQGGDPQSQHSSQHQCIYRINGQRSDESFFADQTGPADAKRRRILKVRCHQTRQFSPLSGLFIVRYAVNNNDTTRSPLIENRIPSAVQLPCVYSWPRVIITYVADSESANNRLTVKISESRREFCIKTVLFN